MGTTFCNLSIYGADLSAVEAVCPQCIVRSLMPDWITVAGEDLDWETTRKEAKRISKALPYPVLSTEFFDDDYAVFMLYVNGKKAASHIPAAYDGMPRAAGRSKAWAEALGLPEEAEQTLKAVFKETNAETCLHLLECVLHCPLWLDAETIEEVVLPAQTYLTEYQERKSKEEKIKNQTKLTLLHTMDGDFHHTYPVVNNEDTLGVKSFWVIDNGAMRKLFEKTIPGWLWEAVEGDRYENTFLLAFRGTGMDNEFIAYVFSDAGEVLQTFRLEDVVRGTILDRERVLLNGACYNMQTKEKEWELEGNLRRQRICSPCRLDSGRFAAIYDTFENERNQGRLVSFWADGSDKAVQEIPSTVHWKSPVVYRDTILFAWGHDLVCYSASLEELWRVRLADAVGKADTVCLDAGTGMLYFSDLDHYFAFDLDKREMRAKREFAEDCFMYDVLPDVGPIMMTGDSSIQVWNADLQMISRHRVKGELGKIVHQDGKVYVFGITEANRVVVKTRTGEFLKTLKQGCLRLYELKR